jgi:hypothetical protein
MKDSRLVLAFFLGVIVTGSFFCMEKKTPAEEPKPAEATATSAEGTGSTSLDEATFNDLKSKYENYAKEYDLHRRDTKKFKKDSLTQCMWYPIDQFIDSITRLKKDFKASGVRIYFGVYPKGSVGNTETGQKEDVSGRLTLFFVGTKSEQTNIRGRNIINVDILDPANKTFAVADFRSFNEGTLCPPPRDSCKTLGATLLP